MYTGIIIILIVHVFINFFFRSALKQIEYNDIVQGEKISKNNHILIKISFDKNN